MSSTDEIDAELVPAKKALRAAEILLNQGLLEDSISRSYYAILHAAGRSSVSFKAKASFVKDQ